MARNQSPRAKKAAERVPPKPKKLAPHRDEPDRPPPQRGRRKTKPKTPRHNPTDKGRKHVEFLVAAGTPKTVIAGIMGIDPDTLAKHYPTELAFGADKANALVAQALFQQATGRPAEYNRAGQRIRAEMKPRTRAAEVWLKCRGGWVETQRNEITGADGGPVELTQTPRERVAGRIASIASRLGTSGDPGGSD